MDETRKARDLERSFWFNTTTNSVEEGMLSPATDRIGPFATHYEASNAMNVVRERALRWAAEEAADQN